MSPVPRLIEVALPIAEISAESIRQKKSQRGHISTLHLWWARRSLEAAKSGGGESAPGYFQRSLWVVNSVKRQRWRGQPSILAEKAVQNPATTRMALLLAVVENIVVVAPGIRKGVGQDGEAFILPFVVDGRSKGQHGGCSPLTPQIDGTAGAMKNLPKKLTLGRPFSTHRLVASLNARLPNSGVCHLWRRPPL